MKTFVVSLERAIERRNYMSKHLSELDLNFEIIDAVDYQLLTPEDYNTLSDVEAVKKDVWLTKGAIACALSHVKVFNKIVDEKIDVCLILEDDAALPKNIKSVLAQLSREIQQDEVIALSFYNRYHRVTELSLSSAKQLDKSSQLISPVNLGDVASMMAYIVTYDVAKKLKDILMPIRIQADYWSAYYAVGGFSSFRCYYPVVAYPAVFRSTLDYAAATTFFSKAAAVVRRYNIPLLVGYLNRRADSILRKAYVFKLVDKPAFNAR